MHTGREGSRESCSTVQVWRYRWEAETVVAKTTLAVTVYFTEGAVLQTDLPLTLTCSIRPLTGTLACLGRDSPEEIELEWTTDTPEHWQPLDVPLYST